MHGGVPHGAPENVRPLVVVDVRGADGIAPARGEAEVHQVQLLLRGRARGAEQEVLRLDVPVHEPFAVEVLQDRQRLHCDARHHLLRHELAVLVPRVPQARAEQVHHHHVVLALPPFVVHLGHTQDPAQRRERVVHGPLVRRAVVAPLAAPVLKLQRHLHGVVTALVRGAGAHAREARAHVHLPEPALAELPLHLVHWGPADLRLRR